MEESKLKGKVVTLNIVQKAMNAIAGVFSPAQLKTEVDFNIPGQLELFSQYEQTVAELNELYEKNKAALSRMSELYVHSERLRRVITPKVYVNAYLEKRNFSHVYINANCGFVNQAGKVENVMAFMGKSTETDVQKAQAKIDADKQLQLQAKRAIIEKLIKKLTATEMETKPVEINQVIHISYDLSKNNVFQLMQLFLAKNKEMKKTNAQVNEQGELEQAMILIEELLKDVDQRVQ
jgi:hypothetical protein